MEIVMIIVCIISLLVNLYMFREYHPKPSTPFTDDEIDKIKQVLNILTWGGEDEN